MVVRTWEGLWWMVWWIWRWFVLVLGLELNFDSCSWIFLWLEGWSWVGVCFICLVWIGNRILLWKWWIDVSLWFHCEESFQNMKPVLAAWFVKLWYVWSCWDANVHCNWWKRIWEAYGVAVEDGIKQANNKLRWGGNKELAREAEKIGSAENLLWVVFFIITSKTEWILWAF